MENSAGGARAALSQVWQLPALAISLAMFGFGLYLSQPGDQSADYAKILDETRALVASGQHMVARENIDELAGGIGGMSTDLQSEFYLLRGDVVFMGQRSKGWSHAKNHEMVIESYLLSRDLGAPLDNDHLERLGESLADIGDYGAALEYMMTMGDEGSYVRQTMYRRAIRHALDSITESVYPPTASARPRAAVTEEVKEDEVVAEKESTEANDVAATEGGDEGVEDKKTGEALIAKKANYVRDLGYGAKLGYSEQDVVDHIRGLRNEPLLTEENEVWATARDAELLMRQGRHQQANSRLMRQIARMLDQPDELKGELMLMLGRTFLNQGEGGPGDLWVSRAIEALPDADPLRGESLVEKGRILLNEDNALGAMDYFREVTERYSDTRAYLGGLVGQADCEARTGMKVEAMNHYRDAVKITTGDMVRHAAVRDLLLESLSTQHDLRFGQEQYDEAMEYLDIELALYLPPGPSELLLKRARTLENLGRKKLGLGDGEVDSVEAWDSLNDEGKEIAANYYADSADAYLRHAHFVAAEEDGSYGDSLWNAGDYYDKAGLYKQAILAFREYVENKTEDPRSLRATFRLAQAQRADEEYEESIVLYRRLIEEHGKSPEAYSSLVPLARSYIARGGRDDLSQAEHVLGTVVNGHEAIRPESLEFKEALRELGQLYYHRGEENDYADAATMFTAYADRYGADETMPELHFQLGDSYRKMVSRIETDLGGSMTPQNKATLEGTRKGHLEKAMESFKAVINAYESSPASEPSALEEIYLRNAYFYRADCAYDLKMLEGAEGAIELYNKAQQRYRNHPMALLALIQIVNSHATLEQWDEAKTTNNRAKKMLESIPEEAFDDPTLPMNRALWQNWLEWSGGIMNGQPTQTATVPTP